MNKKLVALAVAGALALPVAANAQTANVTLYGRVNMDIEVVKGRLADGSNPSVFRVNSNSSNFGIRGTESLGGGLNAIFQVESGVPWDVGGGTLATRNSFVGLQGGWGTVKLGLYHLPYDTYIHDRFGSVPTLETGILATSAIWAQGAESTATGTFDNRVGNTIMYTTPNMSGFEGSVSYSSGETANHAGIISAGGAYVNGPIDIGVAVRHNEDARVAGFDDTAFSVGGGYNFGFLRVGAVYERLKYEQAVGDLKRDFWAVSLTAPVGVGTVYAMYGRAGDGKGGAPDSLRIGGLAHGSDTSSQMYEISYTHPMSKRTSLYAGYVKIDNDSRASYNFGVNSYPGLPTPVGIKPSGAALGVWHNF